MTDPQFRLSCYALIRNSKQEILLLQRLATAHFPNQWELPGGKLDPSETPDEAVRREAQEETSLKITPQSLSGAVQYDIRGFRVIMLVLECRLDGGEVRVSNEHQAFRWMPDAHVTELDLTPPLREIFEKRRR